MKRQVARDIGIVVEQGDALAIQVDVLALKYANALHGVDRAVVQALTGNLPDIRDRLPKPHASFHRRSNAQRLMDAREVVEEVEQGDRVYVVR